MSWYCTEHEDYFEIFLRPRKIFRNLFNHTRNTTKHSSPHENTIPNIFGIISRPWRSKDRINPSARFSYDFVGALSALHQHDHGTVHGHRHSIHCTGKWSAIRASCFVVWSPLCRVGADHEAIQPVPRYSSEMPRRVIEGYPASLLTSQEVSLSPRSRQSFADYQPRVIAMVLWQ